MGSEMCIRDRYWVPAKDAAVTDSPDIEGCVSEGWPLFKWSDADGLSTKGELNIQNFT